jgi:pimeloyl-ACP methyl ester carboxylesterase
MKRGERLIARRLLRAARHPFAGAPTETREKEMSLQPRRKHTSRAARAILKSVALFAFLFTMSSMVFAQEASRDIKVDRINFPVTLSDGRTYTVAGYLYYQGSYRNRTVLLALHGANYNHKYWDVPSINGHEYSFARYMAEQKYAVLAIDQLGTGSSSKPQDGDLLTLAETGSAIHQIITRLRSGEGEIGHAFDRVVLVGHSLGSINAVYAQGTYQDADAVITTGMGHVPHALPIPDSVIGEMLQLEYFSFPEALRANLFYHAAGADPEVVAYDRDSLADFLPRGQLVTGIFNTFNPVASRVGEVTGPVLVQLGEHDALFPASLGAGEAAFYTSASSVTVQTLHGVGHNVNTHLGNRTSWQMMDEWIRAAGLR